MVCLLMHVEREDCKKAVLHISREMSSCVGVSRTVPGTMLSSDLDEERIRSSRSEDSPRSWAFFGSLLSLCFPLLLSCPSLF